MRILCSSKRLGHWRRNICQNYAFPNILCSIPWRLKVAYTPNITTNKSYTGRKKKGGKKNAGLQVWKDVGCSIIYFHSATLIHAMLNVSIQSWKLLQVAKFLLEVCLEQFSGSGPDSSGGPTNMNYISSKHNSNTN